MGQRGGAVVPGAVGEGAQSRFSKNSSRLTITKVSMMKIANEPKVAYHNKLLLFLFGISYSIA